MKSRITDPDLAKSRDALLRAGQRARELAERTGTPLVTWRDGKVFKEIPAPGSTVATPWTARDSGERAPK